MSKYLLNNGYTYLDVADSGSHERFATSRVGKINTVIDVNENSTICAIPERFIGQSTSNNMICASMSSIPDNIKLKNLMTNLGPSRFRFICNPGLTWDRDSPTYTCTGSKIRNSAFVDIILNLLRETDYKLVWGLPLEDNDITTSSDEVDYIWTNGSDLLEAFAFGNEPDYWVDNGYRTSPFTVSDYINQWNAFYTTIKALNASIPIEGLELGYEDTWFTGFVDAEYNKVSYITQHYYPLSAHGAGVQLPTIDNLLAESTMRRMVTDLQYWKNYTNSKSVPFAIGEANSVSSGGTDNISNTMAAALWCIDFLFTNLQLGIRNVNFHGFIGGNSYSSVTSTFGIYPLYYGLLFFHNSAPDGSCVTLNSTTYLNVKSYATMGTDNKLRVVLVNKGTHDDAYVSINVQNTYTSAKTLYLKAPNVASTGGLKFGGSSVSDTDGTWTPSLNESVTIIDKNIKIDVPRGSAVLVTFE